MSLNHISVVILNWNGKELLEKFLPSVIANSGDAKIILADNGSTDDSMKFVKENHPTIEIIVNKTNSGFAKGYNDVLKKINNEIYVLLNNDIEVTPNWLIPLSKIMEDKKVAACQPKILSYKNKISYEHAGASGGFVDKNYYPFCRGRIFNHVEEDTKQYDGKMEIFWATGACLMIRSNYFHEIEGFDDDFFAHMEEIDLCWRLKKLNLKIIACPDSKVFHLGGGTLQYNSPKKVYLNFRNSLMMITKNHEGYILPKIILRLTLDGLAAFTFLLRNGEIFNFTAIFRAHLSYYLKLRLLLRKRRQIQSKKSHFNSKGIYRGSIITSYFLKKKNKFSNLDQKLF